MNQLSIGKLLLSCLLLFTGDTEAQNMSDTTRGLTRVLLNESYGEDARQKMDVYLPPNAGPQTKLMVIVHGGAWVRGDKSEFSRYVTALQGLLPDYAFANVNYRLFRQGTNKFPAQEDDMRAAVGYLNSKIDEWGISRKLVLLGASAGAHLALLQAYKEAGSFRPLAVVSFFGPTDLRVMYENSPNPDVKPMLRNLLGSDPEQNPDLYNNSSPARFVTKDSPPTLLLHGGRDRLVNESQARLLEEKLRTHNVPHELKVYPAEGHGWTGPALFDSFARVAAFLKKHVP
jgi:acetyl esterase/lipase